jgi:hypothetical protein
VKTTQTGGLELSIAKHRCNMRYMLRGEVPAWHMPAVHTVRACVLDAIIGCAQCRRLDCRLLK